MRERGIRKGVRDRDRERESEGVERGRGRVLKGFDVLDYLTWYFCFSTKYKWESDDKHANIFGVFCVEPKTPPNSLHLSIKLSLNGSRITKTAWRRLYSSYSLKNFSHKTPTKLFVLSWGREWGRKGERKRKRGEFGESVCWEQKALENLLWAFASAVD
jgi:hypothetical protein